MIRRQDDSLRNTSVTQMAYNNFCTLIADLVDNHDTREIAAKVRSAHAEQLAEITPHIVENAIINIARNVKRRKAKLIVDGAGDLFGEFNIPAKMPLPGKLSKHSNSKLLPSHKFTKLELGERIRELQDKPSKKDRLVVELVRLFEAIDKFCGEDEQIEVGLRRAKGSS